MEPVEECLEATFMRPANQLAWNYAETRQDKRALFFAQFAGQRQDKDRTTSLGYCLQVHNLRHVKNHWPNGSIRRTVFDYAQLKNMYMSQAA